MQLATTGCRSINHSLGYDRRGAFRRRDPYRTARITADQAKTPEKAVKPACQRAQPEIGLAVDAGKLFCLRVVYSPIGL